VTALPEPDAAGDPMIGVILPVAVHWAEAFTDPPDAIVISEEEALVRPAVEKRRREFATTRRCARRALANLGIEPVPILSGERGEPLWPRGVVGSMTHCHGYRCAAVALAGTVASLGIDAEPNAPLPDGTLDVISRPSEQEHVARLRSVRSGTAWDRLLFSAKEATYKAWFPLMRTWLDFGDAEIRFDPETGCFTSRLMVPGPRIGSRTLGVFAGRWLATDALIATAITIMR
jgi:4'-phosphopantetheinyl transferase EntD